MNAVDLYLKATVYLRYYRCSKDCLSTVLFPVSPAKFHKCTVMQRGFSAFGLEQRIYACIDNETGLTGLFMVIA